MPLIYVRAKTGRVAFDAPRGGRRIPTDQYVPVEQTRYVERLLYFHGDIELQPAAAPKSSPQSAAASAKTDSKADKKSD